MLLVRGHGGPLCSRMSCSMAKTYAKAYKREEVLPTQRWVGRTGARKETLPMSAVPPLQPHSLEKLQMCPPLRGVPHRRDRGDPVTSGLQKWGSSLCLLHRAGDP